MTEPTFILAIVVGIYLVLSGSLVVLASAVASAVRRTFSRT